MRHPPVALPLIPLAMLFVVPFVVWNHLPPVTSFYAEWWAALLGLLAVLAAPGLWGQWRLPQSSYAFLGLAGLMAAQPLVGQGGEYIQVLVSILYLFGGVALLLMARLLASQLGSETVVIILVWALVIGGALNTLFAVEQTWSFGSMLTEVVTARRAGGAYGNLAQTNHLASYLGIGLASVLYLIINNKIRLALALVLGCWLVFGLCLTASRSAWLEPAPIFLDTNLGLNRV